MVHKSFTNSFGPEYGEDDRTDFLYERQEHEALKRLVDGVNIAIYRDGNAGEKGNLDVLIRKSADLPYGVEYAAEMIPVSGAISHIETLWSASSEENYKTFAHPNRFEVGVMDDDQVIQVLSVWYNREGYEKANPQATLDTQNTQREHTPQEPIKCLEIQTGFNF